MLPFDNEVIAYALAFTISTRGAACNHYLKCLISLFDVCNYPSAKVLTFMLCFLFVGTIIGIVLSKRQRWSSISWFRSVARSLVSLPTLPLILFYPLFREIIPRDGRPCCAPVWQMKPSEEDSGRLDSSLPN